MTIDIDNRTTFVWGEKWEEIIKKAIWTSLELEEFSTECEISVSIVTNEEMQAINREFRNIDKATDVLSFPQLTFEEGEIADVNEKNEIVLGDIIISIDKAQQQAEEYEHSLEREVAFLTIHSMLHLMGYDHMEPEEEKEMIQKQKLILQKTGLIE